MHLQRCVRCVWSRQYWSGGLAEEEIDELSPSGLRHQPRALMLLHALSPIRYMSSTPGLLGAPNGGTDFNDIVHPFARAVVEGLFGYRPDYSRGVVTLAPTVPGSWLNYSFHGPDFNLKVNITEARSQHQVSISLRQPAVLLQYELQFFAQRVLSVNVNGIASQEWSTRPGYGSLILQVEGWRPGCLCNATWLWGSSSRRGSLESLSLI